MMSHVPVSIVILPLLLLQVSSRRIHDKEVQVIPWALSDSNSIRCPSPRLDPSRTVFVGGLHGLINAGELVRGVARSSLSRAAKNMNN